MNSKLTALGAFAVATVLLSSCAAANGSAPASGGPAGQGQTAPAGAPQPVAASYGDVVGTGTKVTVADGSYETIALDPKSRLYDVAVGGGLEQTLAQSGFTLDDAKSAQKFALDYMVKEFLDSTALETKDDGFKAWIAANGHTYFNDEILGEIATKPDGAQLLLGDPVATKTIPALIHDGKPREKNVNVSVGGVGPFVGNGVKAIQVELTYTAQYRLSVASAATFAGSLATPAMSGPQFLASSSAKPSLKDDQGEHVYGASGSATVVVDKDSQGRWEIDGFKSTTNYDISDFVAATSIAPPVVSGH